MAYLLPARKEGRARNNVAPLFGSIWGQSSGCIPAFLPNNQQDHANDAGLAGPSGC